MPLSKPAIAFHAIQIFFAFIAMCCFASVASFQARFQVGPSPLTNFALFCAITNMFLALIMTIVPVLYDKHNKLMNLARVMREQRVAFILTAAGAVEVFLPA